MGRVFQQPDNLSHIQASEDSDMGLAIHVSELSTEPGEPDQIEENSRGRRRRREETWKKNIRKRSKQLGNEYTSTKGKVM